MRTALIAVILCAAARAAAAAPGPGMLTGGLEQPEGTLLLETPRELRDYDAAAAARRRMEIDRALVHLRTPIGRANARLARATLRLAQARSEWLAWISKEIERSEAQHRAREQGGGGGDRQVRPADREAMEREQAAFKREIARLRLRAEQTRDTGLAELTQILCDPAERGSGSSGSSRSSHSLACPTPPALRAWPDLDEALHRLAFTLWGAKRPADAVRVYRRILDETPRSQHRANALVAVADHAFEQADLATAEPLYRAAQTAAAAGPLRAYAAYKLGWVHLSQGRGPEAFASLTAVPALAGAAPGTTSLVREARRDLARAFATYGAPADAFTALEAAAPGHGLELAGRAGERWLERLRHADAIAVYRELVRRAPADPRRCDWQLGIVRGVQLADDLELLIPELEALAATARDTRGHPAAARCDLDTRLLLDEIGKRQLRDARRRRRSASRAAAGYAERLFAAYVRAFAGDPLLGAARLHRAEAAYFQAEAATGAQAAMLWRRTMARYDEALRGGQLTAYQHASATRGLAHARVNAAARPGDR